MARSFNGTTDFVSLGTGTTLKPGAGSFSVAAWVQLNASAATRTIYASTNVGGNLLLWLFTDTNDFVGAQIMSGTGTLSDVSSNFRITLNKWYHVGLVRDATNTVTLYVDGVQKDSRDDRATDIDSGNDARIGATSAGASFWSGNIGEVGFWKAAALSAAEIAGLAGGALPLMVRRGSLTGYWVHQFTGSGVTDASQNGNNGTATGTAVVDGPPVTRLPPQHYSFPTQGTIGTITSPDVCQADTPFNSFLSLPRAADESDQDKRWDLAMQRLEDIINNRLLSDEACKACPDANGTVVLDLARCSNWEIDTDDPIKRIDMPNARPGQEVNVAVCNRGANPVSVSGWPTAVSSGKIAGTLNPGQCISPTFQVGSGGGISGFMIKGDFQPFGSPGGGGLSISCSGQGGDCTIDCQAASPSVTLLAAGGVPPYSWETTAGTITVSGTNDSIATLTPPANTGTAVAGTAYKKAARHTDSSGAGNACTNCRVAMQAYGCDDVLDTDWADAGAPSCFPSNSSLGCRGGVYSTCAEVGAGCPHNSWIDLSTECLVGHTAQDGNAIITCDTRTDQMITDNCTPCGSTMTEAEVTLTDDFGTSVSKTITVAR